MVLGYEPQLIVFVNFAGQRTEIQQRRTRIKLDKTSMYRNRRTWGLFHPTVHFAPKWIILQTSSTTRKLLSTILPTEANFRLATRETYPVMFEGRSLEGNKDKAFFRMFVRLYFPVRRIISAWASLREYLLSVEHIDNSRTEFVFHENKTLWWSDSHTWKGNDRGWRLTQ